MFFLNYLSVLMTLTCSPRTELRRMRLHEIGPKVYHGVSGSRYTVHVWSRSTAPQPDIISRESILRREENRSTRRKTLGVILRSTKTQPTYEPNQDLNPGWERWEAWMTTSPSWLPMFEQEQFLLETIHLLMRKFYCFRHSENLQKLSPSRDQIRNK